MHLAYFKLYLIKCIDCGLLWQTTNPQAQRCAECRKRHRQQQRLARLVPQPAQ